MSKFKFSLEQLLKYRKDMTESAKLRLASKSGEITLLEQQIIASKQESKQNFLLSRERFDAMELRQSEHFYTYQQAKQKEAKLSIRRIEYERQEVLKIYQERLKSELVLEHLRERAYAQFVQKERQKEQIRLDDMINSLVHADNDKETYKVGEKDGRIF